MRLSKYRDRPLSWWLQTPVYASRIARRRLRAAVSGYASGMNAYDAAVGRSPDGMSVYDQDGLTTAHNHEFMWEPAFSEAYARGVRAGRGCDNRIHWRVHTALWAAQTASRLPGDFVECGVNSGVVSSAIMHHLGWNQLGKHFYLLDTFGGIDEALLTPEERQVGRQKMNQQTLANGGYQTDVDEVIANFSEWERVHVIQGTVPGTLSQVAAKQVCYLHLDMNCAYPERAALEHFWPLLVAGGLVLMDDYTYAGYEPQKRALDDMAASNGVVILSLPTGQGLLIKPPC